MERKDWIDQLRGFAFFIVVLCHASVLGVISHVGAAFHMPLFFMISGLLFYPEKVLERSLISQVGHNFQRKNKKKKRQLKKQFIIIKSLG